MAEVIDLGDSDDEALVAPAPAPAAPNGTGSSSADAFVIDDDDESLNPVPAAAAAPSNAGGTSASDAIAFLDDDDDDLAAAQAKRRRLEMAACKLCGAARLSNPYKLSECGHSFCRDCIRDFVSRKLRRVLASEVVCPTCSKQLTINDVNTLSAGGDSHVPPHVATMMRATGMSAAQLVRLGGVSVGGGPHGGRPSEVGPNVSGHKPQGSSVATRRLMKELQAIRKGDAETQGFSVDLPDPDNLYTWDAHFFGFEKGSALAQDLKKSRHTNGRIELRIAFPSSYPAAPPYIRVIRPRFAFRTGHVTLGGSICTEILTTQGWASTMTVESALISIRTNMLVGGARLDLADKRDYHEAEAREAFDRMMRTHGWY